MTVPNARTSGVAPAALHARAHVAAHLLDRRPALHRDLADRRAAACGRRRRARRSRRSSPARAAPARSRSSTVLIVSIECGGVAGEDVRAAGAVVVQQPAPVRVAALDLRRVLRVVGDDRAAEVLLPPAEGGHVVVVAVQQPRLAGAGLRGPVASPSRAAGSRRRASSGRATGALPSRSARRSTSWASPSISRNTNPGMSWCARQLRALELAADDVAVPEVAAVEREHAAEQRRQQRQAEHHDDGLEQPGDVHRAEDRRDASSTAPLTTSAPSPSVRTVNGSANADQQRPDDGVRDAERRRERERRPGVVDREAREDPRQQEQCDCVQQQDDDESADQANRQIRAESERFMAGDAPAAPGDPASPGLGEESSSRSRRSCSRDPVRTARGAADLGDDAVHRHRRRRRDVGHRPRGLPDARVRHVVRGPDHHHRRLRRPHALQHRRSRRGHVRDDHRDRLHERDHGHHHRHLRRVRASQAAFGRKRSRSTTSPSAWTRSSG